MDEAIDAARRRELADRAQRNNRPVVPVFDDAGGPCPGIDLTSTSAQHEVLDDGADLDQMR